METNRIYLGDCNDILKTLPDESIDLVVTSPPYDTLRKYNGSAEGWCRTKFESIARELFRILKKGGTIVWVVNDKIEKGSKTGTSFRQALYFMDLGLCFNNDIIWRKTNPMPQVKQPRYSSCYEHMFVFCKGKPKTFNPIMEPCKLGGKLYDSTAKNMDGESGRHKLTYVVNKEKVKNDVWDIAIAQNKTEHPAVFPIQIALDHIKSWSNEGDVVLDPFIGSGTTALACIELNRKFIGIELNEKYYQMCNERIEKLKNNEKY